MLFASFLVRLRFDQSKLLAKYAQLFFMTSLFRKEIRRRISTTSGIYNLKKEHIEKVEIPIPPLETQRQIVERLDAIRKAQELNDKQISLAEELFQSLLHRELDPKGKNWEIKRLGEVCEVNPKISPDLNRDKVKYVEMAAIDENLKQIKYFLERPISKISSGTPKFVNNDVIFARITPCTENGKVAFVENCESVCAGSTELHVLRAKQNELLPRFLFYCLIIPRVKDLAVASMTGSTGRQRVPAEFFHYLKIPHPPLETQHQIVEKLQAVQGYKRKLLRQKEFLSELFQSVLHQELDPTLRLRSGQERKAPRTF
jgi:type I restriction enzyme S subunit